ncbi:hypothetical protein AB9F29_16705 [Falsihalocynthiibacter sp. S25ZX9]|uniref:hypothetical protein n=1 Tax=Falsihalocynthiibacter sp. S25ZX9 TaxID=3240870 RepID=UPI00350F64AD
MSNKQVSVRVTSAIGVGGKIHKPGAVLRLDEAAAKSLLRRGKVEIAGDKAGKSASDLSSKTRAELEAFADEKEIDVSEAKNKADVLALIEAALEG